MGECPAGQELRIALGNMACKSCGCQCMVRHLMKEVENIKMDAEDLDSEISNLKRK